MFHFTPTSSVNHLVTPRDKYFAALAEARVAEAEYLSVLAKERVAKRLREEQRDRVIRRQLLVDSLYNQEATYPIDDPLSSTCPTRFPFTGYPAQHRSHGFYSEDILPYHQGEQEHIFSALRRRQHAAERRRLELLRQQEDRELARVAFIQQQRRRQEKDLHQFQANRSRGCAEVDQILNVLGERSQNIVEQQRESRLSQRKPFTQGDLLAYLSGGSSEPVVTFGPRQQVVSHLGASPPRSLPESQSISKTRSKATLDDLLAHTLGLVTPKEHQQVSQPVAKPASEPQAQASSSAPPLKVHPEAHNPEVEIPDIIQGLLSCLFNPAHAPESQPKPQTQTPVPQATAAETEPHTSNAASAATPASTTPVSLREQLEARLLSDADAEIRDTVQALIASLYHPAPQGPSTPDVKAATSVAEGSGKGKGKAKQVAFDIPISAPTSLDVTHAVETVRNIEASFHAIESDFVFPSNLDFDVDPAASASLPPSSALKLAYTSKNAAVRHYEHALSSLLTQLDSVDSWGNEELRNKRKEVVAKVETALEAVEREIEGRLRVWAKKHAVTETGRKAEVKAENVKADQPSGPGNTLESKRTESVADVTVQPSVLVVKESSPVTREEPVRTTAAEEFPDSIVSTITSEKLEPVVSDKLEVGGLSAQSTTVEVEVREDLTDVSVNADSIVSPITENTPAVADDAAPSSSFPDATDGTDALDTFLLPASTEQSLSNRARYNDGDGIDASRDDAGSDWSEVEA